MMTRDHAHDPRAIANKIYEMMRAEGRGVTLMQIIKLVYLADGWSLALRGIPLSKQSPQAWQYGPVFPTVYKAFKKFGARPITDLAVEPRSGVPVSEEFSDDEVALLKQVVESYGALHAFRLSEIMHKPGTPWTETFNTSGPYAEIPLELIAGHFAGLRDERGIASS